MPIHDTALLSFYDYERIKKNAYIPSREESLNNERIHKEQKDTQLAKARALKEKIQKYDKNKPKYFLSDIEREKIISDKKLLARAQKYHDDNERHQAQAGLQRRHIYALRRGSCEPHDE